MTISVGNLKMIPLSSIIISERARKELGNLDELETNMKETGLITPLAVKYNQDETYTLLAGERRYTVLKRNNVEQIPVRIYEENLSEIQMKVIEKSENFYRKDMEYYEMDNLTKEIHQLQQELHGVKTSGPGRSGWSMNDTAEMVGDTKSSISMAIKRAEIRDRFPDLFQGCKTASDATKVIKKLDEAVLKQALAEKLHKENNNSLLTKLGNSFIINDFFEGVKDIPDNVFHLVEVDPPYSIGLMERKKSKEESQYIKINYNEVPQDKYLEFLQKTFKECYRVMTEHSWLLCWFAPEPWFDEVFKSLKCAGFGVNRMCPIWIKSQGQTLHPDIYLPNSYEMFFYAWKGRPAIAKPRGTNIFNQSPIFTQNKCHPTERPIDLMKDVYETFAFPGSRILIPFLGSGNGLIAAHQAGMTGIGFELSKGYKDSFLVKVNGMK
jgi:ParB/RepB/Spo0J family partition protein